MFWVFVVLSVVAVVVVALVAVGREALGGATRARPAVFDLEEAVGFVSDRLTPDVASRLTHDDVRWVLRADVDEIEAATAEADHLELGAEVLDEDVALGRVLAAADEAGVDLRDTDVAAVLAGRTAYLEAIGALGPRADPSEVEPPSS